MDYLDRIVQNTSWLIQQMQLKGKNLTVESLEKYSPFIEGDKLQNSIYEFYDKESLLQKK